MSWRQKTSSSRRLIGIFHPHCDQRAGGEMVLWSLIKYILSLESLANAEIIVYTNALPKHFATSGYILKEKTKSQSSDILKGSHRENPTRKHLAGKSSLRSDEELFDPLSRENNISKMVEEGNFESFHASRILDDASRVFGIDAFADMSKPENVLMRSRVKFHFLKHSDMTDPNHYSRLTLLLQFLAASISVCEIMYAFLRTVFTTKSDFHRMSLRLILSYFGFKDAKKSAIIGSKLSSQPPILPDVIIDTAGYPFVLPLFKSLSFFTAAYVHYPIITYAMVDRVRQQNTSVMTTVENSKKRQVLMQAKIVYYRAFRFLYALTGWGVDMVMCNSSWTKNQLSKIWGIPSSTLRTIFPPCKLVGKETNTPSSFSYDSNDMNRKPHFLSLGQFRPEKDHVLQLTSFALALKYLRRTRTMDGEEILLRMIGTTRPQDLPRIEALKVLAEELGVASQVEFYFDLPFPVLREKLTEGYFGVHTMLDEHFGIGVVELAEAGLVTIAHNSAGPQLDIIVPSIVYNKEKGDYVISIAGIEQNEKEILNSEHGAVGLLANDVETYAQMMLLAISMYEDEKSSFLHPFGESTSDIGEDSEKMPKLPSICRLGARENECATQSMRRQARDRMRSHFSIEAFQKSVDSTLIPLLLRSFGTKIE